MKQLQAYRGVSAEAPENTWPAVELAVAQGYPSIWVDVNVTKDGRFVLLADDTINRTARRQDGSVLSEPICIKEITYEQTGCYDFGRWFSLKYKGAELPLLEDVLAYARRTGIKVSVHEEDRNFSTIQKEELSKLLLVYADVVDEADSDRILSTTGRIKPVQREGVAADVHLHSQNSHDSKCPVIDMALAQKERGISIMAITDHCDTGFSSRMDFSNIEASYEEVKKTDGAVKDLQILTGVEIAGSFVDPVQGEKASKLLPYDVIIGSVHSVFDPATGKPIGLAGATEFSEEKLYEYLNVYYDSMLTMTEVLDFDILAHMTYPIRYLTGRFGIQVDLERVREKIDEILRRIIRKGIALEVNTSSYDILNDTMPGRDLLQRYHDMGGYLITLGSDAHAAQNAAKAFDEAFLILKEIGFDNIFYYKERKGYQCKIK